MVGTGKTNKELSSGVTEDAGPNLGGEDVIGCRGVLCVENLVRAGLQGCSARGKCKCKGPEVGRNKVGSSNLDRACVAGA